MTRLIAFVVAVGLAIGLVLPAGKPKPAAAAGTPSAREVVLTRGSTGHFFTRAKINGKATIRFIVDTGASDVALTLDDARAIGLKIDPSTFAVVGEGVGGPVRGQRVVLDSIEVDGIRKEHVRAMVLENSTLSLLGQSFLTNIDHVDMSGDYLSLREDS